MKFDLSVITSNLPLFERGLEVTVLYCGASSVLGLCLGSVVALARLSRTAWLRGPAALFVEIIRDTPFLVQAFVIFFVVPASGLPVSAATAGIAALTLYGGAYFAESIRAAIVSVPRGQVDAARAAGMSHAITLRRIVFPQMMAYLLPPLTNQLIGLIKDSSVLSIITVPELTMATQTVVGTTFAPIEAFSMVALTYWALTAAVAWAMGILEHHTPTRRAARQTAAFMALADR
jgi:His/Glu/Gln/Arg/opine family amino acid ABC transporter permease subunit